MEEGGLKRRSEYQLFLGKIVGLGLREHPPPKAYHFAHLRASLASQSRWTRQFKLPLDLAISGPLPQSYFMLTNFHAVTTAWVCTSQQNSAWVGANSLLVYVLFSYIHCTCTATKCSQRQWTTLWVRPFLSSVATSYCGIHTFCKGGRGNVAFGAFLRYLLNSGSDRVPF